MRSGQLLRLFIALVSIVHSIEGYKFLVVLHFSSKSHFIVGSALIKGLIDKGHEVTVISPFPLKKPMENWQDVPVPSVLKLMKKETENILDTTGRSLLENLVSFHKTGVEVTKLVLNEPAVQKLMASNQTFDAVINEVFLSEALYGLSEHFKAPLIGLGTFGAIAWNTDMVGSPSPPSYVASTFLPFTDHMTFRQRIINLALLTFERLFLDFYYLPMQEEVFRQYFPESKKSMYEIRKDTALVLLNSHVSLSFPRPYVPNQIEVGGMHINRQRKPLPEAIERFINEAQYGVVYFSMGSNIKSKNIPLEKRQELLKALGSLKQRVLWKFEDTQMEGKPDNVLISDWFPQDDILAHDNVKLFITHGGLLSTTESVYHGKPFIGIPIFGDQFLNMAKAEANGYGIMLDYKNLTADAILQAVNKMLSDPLYTKLVRAMSQRYRDQPMDPLDKAVYWVEHVARHKGAKYLHCAGLDLNFIQYHSIDTIITLYGGLLFVVLSLLWLLKAILGCIFRSMCNSSRSKSKNDGNVALFAVNKRHYALETGLLKIEEMHSKAFTISSFVLLSILAISTLNVVAGYKYLAVLHTPSKSHFIVGSSLMRALAEKGHEVYVISPFPQKQPIKNYHDIPIPSMLNAFSEKVKNFFDISDRSLISSIFSRYDLGIYISEVTLTDPNVQNLMTSNHTFDAVICEVFFAELLVGLSEHFNAPLIGLSTFGAVSSNTDMVGSPSPPSYVPHFVLPFSDRMTLMERVKNLAFVSLERILMEFYYLPRQAALYRKYFPHLKRDMYEVRKNAAVVLLNTHVSLAFPRPYVPNQIEVGGIHINRKRKPLPEDIRKFIDEAKHGVIYFSMGSNLKGKDMPDEKKNEIMKAFKGLKQRILWKFEEKEMQGKPDNVMISDWFPQDDILAHDNVKLFITHGGLLSTTESIFHAKPFIGIPIFGDQFLNMANAEKNGCGLTLDYKTLNAESLRKALDRILHEGSFKERVVEISNRFKDQDMLPMDKAIYWVEHVVRQKGASYLHCAGLDLNFIQYHNIEAILILYGGFALILVVVICVIMLLGKSLWKLIKPKQKKRKQKKN
ncbi:uncharacterized protein LOC142221536 [Haematobia irritans]|uniref:uncharacterized protein LOC142221536 n=1 Tax=Haematobia irritans TaxID=7368 RepID=UPI003F50CEB3